MKRALLPITLLSIGFVAIVWATMAMPLYEWKVYESSSSWWIWKAKLGESFDDGSYLIHKDLSTQDKRNCLQENFVISRSSQEEKLERLSLTINKSIPWLYGLNMLGIILSGVYILWFTNKREKLSVSSVIIFPIILCWCLTNILIYSLKMSPMISIHSYTGTVNCYPEAITLNAQLTQIYFAMPIVLFIGILLASGAFGIMIKEILRQAVNDQEPSEFIVD